jgi:hypothetical protein
MNGPFSKRELMKVACRTREVQLQKSTGAATDTAIFGGSK